MNNLERLHTQFGQSPWLDDLSRELLESGDLKKFISQGIRGVTSNPSILDKAITSGTRYDAQISALKVKGLDAKHIYYAIVQDDIREAARLLRTVWEKSDGRDGFVSLEVSPDTATTTENILKEARELWNAVDQPNLMIKVPATEAGIPAIEQLLSEGININVTLIFSNDYYRRVVHAFKNAYHKQPSTKAHSVASFFVSRIDAEVDKRLEVIGTEEALNLRGQAAVANAHQAYAIFLDEFNNSPSDQIQKLLWASTSTKNPDYEDLLYVRYLLAQPTVNTMPEATIENVLDHLPADARTITEEDIIHANNTISRIEAVGVDMKDVFHMLEKEGEDKFEAAFSDLLSSIENK